MGKAVIRLCLVVTLLFSAASAVINDQVARQFPEMAKRLLGELELGPNDRFYFAAEGGFRPVFEGLGGEYLRQRVADLPEGAWVLVPLNCHDFGISEALDQELSPEGVVVESSGIPLRLESTAAHAGFYAHLNGYLPLSFSHADLERLVAYRRVGKTTSYPVLAKGSFELLEGTLVECPRSWVWGFHRVLFAHPPSKARVRLEIKPGAVLHGGMGLDVSASAFATGDGVVFRIWAHRPESRDSRKLLWSGELTPSAAGSSHVYQEFQLSLDGHSGPLELDFETSCGPHSDCGWDWGYWLFPRLEYPE